MIIILIDKGHEANPMLPTWRKQWGWATWGRDFKVLINLNIF